MQKDWRSTKVGRDKFGLVSRCCVGEREGGGVGTSSPGLASAINFSTLAVHSSSSLSCLGQWPLQLSSMAGLHRNDGSGQCDSSDGTIQPTVPCSIRPPATFHTRNQMLGRLSRSSWEHRTPGNCTVEPQGERGRAGRRGCSRPPPSNDETKQCRCMASQPSQKAVPHELHRHVNYRRDRTGRPSARLLNTRRLA